MMAKIRILMVLGNTRRGGTQAFIMNLLRNIDRDRFQIDFAVNLDFDGGWGPEMRALGSEIFIMPVFKIYNWFSFARAWSVFFDNHKYDIVHGHTTNSAGIYLKIARKKGCKTIAHVHSSGFRGNYVERLSKRFFCKLTKKQADYWFACSEKAAQLVYGAHFTEYPYYYEMPNAIDVSRYLFSKEVREKIRKELCLTNDCFLCGHVGTFSTPKNHAHLLKVFAEIVKVKPNSKLILIGEGYLKEEIETRARDLNVFESIIWKKNLGNVNEYLMAMDLFIFPSLFEGFGMVSLEAQATGLNVIQSDVIPCDTLLTDHVVTMSLSETPQKWAERALSMKQHKREDSNEIISKSKYNLKYTIEKVSTLYENLDNK